MQNKWYGDKHDLVKWGTLIHLADGNPPARILQVLMLRPDNERNSSVIENYPQGHRQHPISPRVFDHFRCVQNITSLDRRIVIYDEPFPEQDHGRRQEKRERYFGAVCEWIRRFRGKRLVVLVDPDTGIGPINREFKHIAAGELWRLYSAIKEGDTLVLYQHTHYREDWLDARLMEFAKAIRVRKRDVHVFQCLELAGDVALFAVNKRCSK